MTTRTQLINRQKSLSVCLDLNCPFETDFLYVKTMDRNATLVEDVGDSHSCLTTAKTVTTTFQASTSEVAASVLLRIFSLTGQVMAKYVSSRLKQCYGEQRWRDAALDCLGERSKGFLFDRHEKLTSDIYAITEVVLNNIEGIFVDDAADIDEVKNRGILLQRLAHDIDCVNKSRTELFHNVRLSVEEVARCCRCVERLWRRFGLEKECTRSCVEQLDGYTKVRFSQIRECTYDFRPASLLNYSYSRFRKTL